MSAASVAEYLAPDGVRGLAATWRLHVVGDDRVAALHAGDHRIVYAVWHGQLLAPLWHRRGQGISLLVSGHRDGRLLAAAARRWGYETVAGSSTRGGVAGLRGVIRRLRRGGMAAFAPDGPRGPARRAKPGAALAALHGGALLVPVAAWASSAWRMRSWDGFMVPKPFAEVRVVYGPPVTPDDGSADAITGRLETALAAAEAEARCSS